MALRYSFFFLLFLPGLLNAEQDNGYPINEIADSLRRNAAAVIRNNDVTIDIQNIHGCTYSEETVISVLNSSMEELADVKVWYDENRDYIKSFNAWIYDADGKMVKHLGKQDGSEFSATPGYVLAGTSRVKYWDLKSLKAPYTIKYSCVKEISGTFQLPDWMPAKTAGISIQHASFHVNAGEGVSVNYKATGVLGNTFNSKKLLWEINGFNAIRKNEYAPKYWTILPHVLLMAKEFELYGYKGSSKTWNEIGVFMNALMKNRDELGTLNDPKLNDIIKSSVSEKEKVRLIYKYLQDNFRYVCITLGIGGWQPQEASFTMQKKYGDCKSLSMVMKAMLKKAGIESCLVLITAGNESRIELEPDFPHANFNHAILCVPLVNDTIWLECTSQTDPYNYLGSFTDNRRALMIFDGGARIVNTPDYNEKNNLSNTKATIKLNADNIVSVSASITKQSELQDELRAAINQKDAKYIEATIYSSSHLKNTTISSYAVTAVEADMPVASYTLNLTDENTIKQTELRLFIKTNLFSPITSIPEKNEHRTQKVYVNTGYTQSDTLIYILPTGYIPESFKSGVEKEIIDQFGTAKCNIKYVTETGEIFVIRSFCLKHAVYSADQFQPLRDFLLKSIKLCCPELVLKKQA